MGELPPVPAEQREECGDTCFMQLMGMIPRDPLDVLFRGARKGSRRELGTGRNSEVTLKRGSETELLARTDVVWLGP